jgi:hypothetical protein
VDEQVWSFGMVAALDLIHALAPPSLVEADRQVRHCGELVLAG